MKGSFKDNRKAVQRALCDSGLVEELEDSEYCIIEKSNVGKPGTLQKLALTNIPISSEGINVWVLDAEAEPKKGEMPSIFALPATFKRVEKIFIIYSLDVLYIVMVEMKTTIKPNGEDGLKTIKEKFIHSSSWILKLLTIFIHDIDLKICPIGIIAYNNDGVTKAPQDKELSSSDMFQILLGTKNHINEPNLLDKHQQIWIKFVPNISINPHKMEKNLGEIITDIDTTLGAEFAKAVGSKNNVPCL